MRYFIAVSTLCLALVLSIASSGEKEKLATNSYKEQVSKDEALSLCSKVLDNLDADLKVLPIDFSSNIGKDVKTNKFIQFSNNNITLEVVARNRNIGPISFKLFCQFNSDKPYSVTHYEITIVDTNDIINSLILNLSENKPILHVTKIAFIYLLTIGAINSSIDVKDKKAMALYAIMLSKNEEFIKVSKEAISKRDAEFRKNKYLAKKVATQIKKDLNLDSSVEELLKESK